jgi:hypothetical protein
VELLIESEKAGFFNTANAKISNIPCYKKIAFFPVYQHLKT